MFQVGDKVLIVEKFRSVWRSVSEGLPSEKLYEKDAPFTVIEVIPDDEPYPGCVLATHEGETCFFYPHEIEHFFEVDIPA